MIWDKLKHFNINEKWGNPDRMSIPLLLTLDHIREDIGRPIIVHRGHDAGSPPTSHHNWYGRGGAVDFHIEWNKSLFEGVMHIATILDHMNIMFGLGAYPYWNNPGYHIDLRVEPLCWYRDKSDVYRYYGSAVKLAKDLKAIGF